MKKMSKFYFISFFMMMFIIMLIYWLIIIFNFNYVYLFEVEILMLNSILFSYIFYIDCISLMFIIVVLMISSLILMYSKIYIGYECYRFLWMTFLFIMFMVIMILSPSVLGVILGWDGLGIVSYCLVIYYNSSDSFNSGFITAVTNRLGDSMLILSIVWCSVMGKFMFWEGMNEMVFLIMACMTKSAQFPFSAWLPSAMAAPTPISSLVHSSTLVTAGVYLLIRFHCMLMESNYSSWLLLLSSLTIFLAGVSAMKEYDLKRLIALSTLGQLGFMMFILCMGYPFIAFFHLLVHALFKALLFMCAGSLIHSGSMQDMRKLGNLNLDLITKISMNIAIFNLMGLPFSSGFYSKDSLLELVICSNGGMGFGLFILFMAFITVSYCVRLWKLCSSSSGWQLWLFNSKYLLMPILVLAVTNLFMGSLMNWLLSEIELIMLNMYMKMFPLCMLMLGVLCHGELNIKLKLFYCLCSMFYLSSLTKSMSILIKILFVIMKIMDQGLLESLLYKMKSLTVYTSLWMKMFTNEKYIISLGMLMSMILFI